MSAEDSPVLISNLEVKQALEGRVPATGRAGKPQRKYQHCDWIQKQVVSYLESTPCSNLDKNRLKELKNILQSQKKQKFELDSSKSTGFGLTEAETIQILNLMPSELVEIHLIIEELQSRMPEKQQNELLELISSYRKKIAGEDGEGADDVQMKTEDGQLPHPEDDLIEEDKAALGEVVEEVSSAMLMEPVGSSSTSLLFSSIKQEEG
mmetsp:Transcript_20625/g.26595  ORF Transcript_20625/g.26595 Transcript_20625/m.26595 type:complete len:208 (+) Transcript_20625:165-788(+)|eukprot:CAMPEP_0198143736 /NCGR_PEP_ID=MMETSP1443-20131203/10196_1 /TAXON_ID=186043 /ORGANISM="Entomoneis sp., Strain CCMP2396" /LENGTH=207 /DNA_ID=CAMNT_0043807021 /DNA_START=68 /DNA_END=691 /DNA_ORIENTATION=-